MKSIIKKDSGKPGKTLAVFCGVHGNEKVGMLAVEKIMKNTTITKGVVYFVFANPKAIAQNKRFVEKNLNRCFFSDISGVNYEENRAIELMKVLDIVSNMGFEIVATGFDDIEPGATDGYMKNNGKIGICLECGYSDMGADNIDLAYNSILQFLQYYDAIDYLIANSILDQKVLHVDKVQMVTSDRFKITRAFADFETVEKGFVIASDEFGQYIAEKQRVVLFCTPGKPVGAEAYILGTWV